MIPLSIGQIAEITGARLDRVPDPRRMVQGPVVIDSRRMLAGAKRVPGFAGELISVPDGEAAQRALAERLRPGDVVLVKASRAAALQTVALALAAER